MFPIQ